MDLGASPIGAIRRVLLPLLSPAIFASVAIVFASAIDNFVISQRLSVERLDADDPDHHLQLGAPVAAPVAQRARHDRARARRRCSSPPP